MKFLLEFTYDTDKKIEGLLTYTDNKPFKWAMDKQNYDLIKYSFDHNTERGKFLMLCHNNFEVIKDLIISVLLDIRENPDLIDKSSDILKLAISVKPMQILPVIQEIIDNKEIERGINILKREPRIRNS